MLREARKWLAIGMAVVGISLVELAKRVDGREDRSPEFPPRSRLTGRKVSRDN